MQCSFFAGTLRIRLVHKLHRYTTQRALSTRTNFFTFEYKLSMPTLHPYTAAHAVPRTPYTVYVMLVLVTVDCIHPSACSLQGLLICMTLATRPARARPALKCILYVTQKSVLNIRSRHSNLLPFRLVETTQHTRKLNLLNCPVVK